MTRNGQSLLCMLALWVAVLLGAVQAQLEPMRVDPAPVGVDPAEPPRPVAIPAVRPVKPAPAPAPGKGVPVERDQTRVAVLGYHNFSKTAPVSEMLLRTDEFRKQMEYIRKSDLTVISMQEFLEWRFGARRLPAKCVLITMDDGWRSVYTEAYPILREYGYPFHLFLYTHYLTGRGESMSPAMVKEMMRHGASIGSHSVSHLYPKDWKAREPQDSPAYTALIDQELGLSQKRLTNLFGSVNTYCYPGGYVTPAMLERIPGYGYVAAFTVLPGKVTDTEDPFQIHRYMVFGTDPTVFASAMDFRVAQSGTAVSLGTEPGTLPPTTPPPPFAVQPRPDSTVPCDFKLVEANLSGVPGVDMSSLRMSVSGFGRVPARVDAAAKTISWQVPVRIYMPNISVHVTWKTTDGASHKAEWAFKVDPYATAQQ